MPSVYLAKMYQQHTQLTLRLLLGTGGQLYRESGRLLPGNSTQRGTEALTQLLRARCRSFLGHKLCNLQGPCHQERYDNVQLGKVLASALLQDSSDQRGRHHQ